MGGRTRLQSELKQNIPFSSPGEEAIVSLLRTANFIKSQLEAITKPFGLTPQHYNVLRILRGAGDEGLPTLEISNRMIEPSPGITRFIDVLEKKSLVVREQCAVDKRRQICVISAKGLKVLNKLDFRIKDLNEGFTKNLEKEDLAQLMNYLNSIRGYH